MAENLRPRPPPSRPSPQANSNPKARRFVACSPDSPLGQTAFRLGSLALVEDEDVGNQGYLRQVSTSPAQLHLPTPKAKSSPLRSPTRGGARRENKGSPVSSSNGRFGSLPPAAPGGPSAFSAEDKSALDELLDHLSSPQVQEENRKKLMSAPAEPFFDPRAKRDPALLFSSTDSDAALADGFRQFSALGIGISNKLDEAQEESSSPLKSGRALELEEDEEEFRLDEFIRKQSVDEASAPYSYSQPADYDSWDDESQDPGSTEGRQERSSSLLETEAKGRNKRINQERSFAAAQTAPTAGQDTPFSSSSSSSASSSSSSGAAVAAAAGEAAQSTSNQDGALPPSSPRRRSLNLTRASFSIDSADQSIADARCVQLLVGGSKSHRGIRASVFSKCLCNHLICLQCNFEVQCFGGAKWSQSCDYLFFRNNAPDEAKLSTGLDNAAESCAYCCQCSWLNASEESTLMALGDGKQGLLWACAGHKVLASSRVF